MNLLDRAIASFSPQRALSRVQARRALHILARYEAAQPTKTYRPSRDNSTGESQIVRDAATCRAQARDFERNHDIFRGALHTLSRNIVGADGISIEPTPRDANDDINDDLARDLLNLWREFSTRPEVTQTMDWVALQHMACRTWLRDGELFAQIVEGFGSAYRYATRVPLALEMLEADFVPLNYAPDSRTAAGIERNAWGQPLRYFVYKTHPGSNGWLVGADALKHVPAERMLHLAIRERLSGLRGISQFASVITRLHAIKDYEDSECLAARISASIAAYVKRDVNMEWSPDENFDPAAERNFKLRAGAIFDQTLPGEELEMLNPNRPNTALDDFRSSQLRAASRGVGLSNSAMSGNYDGSYSAQRQELVESTDGYRTMTGVFVSQFVRPVWERYVQTAVAAGLVRVPRGVRPETIAQAEFRGPKMPWIDPKKEAEAARTMVRSGFDSAQKVIAERGGRLQDVYEQLARERRLADEIGLVLESDAANGSIASTGTAGNSTDTNNAANAAVDKVIQMNRRKPLVRGIQAAMKQQRTHIEPVMRLDVQAASNAAELLIYGDIGDSWFGESVTALSIVEQLLALDDAVATINVRINSYGGSVSDGLAIYNALKRHPAEKVVTVDGVAMSSASLIAMAGDRVEMPKTSLLMVHAPWGGIAGNAQELRDYAQVLDTYSEAMADAYVARSGMSRDEVMDLLTDGKDHYYTGEQAIEAGFADAVIDPADEAEEPDAAARAFASGLLQRFSAGMSGERAQMAVAAALRMPSRRHAANPASISQPSTACVADPTPAAAGNTSESEETPMTDEERKAAAEKAAKARADILAADKARRESIRAHFAPYANRTDIDAAALQRACEDDPECSADAAGLRLLEALGSRTEPLNPAARVEPGNLDETRTYREGAVAALLHRANPSAHKADERARPFRGYDLVDLARDCVERSGVNARGMAKQEIAVRAMQSTSDFPNILGDTVGRSLRAGYEASARTFTAFARQATLPDFKLTRRVQLAGAPGLKHVLEGAEYEQGQMGEGAEAYQVLKYGRIVAITWETIINDDLDAFARIPQAFGGSAADLESDLVYAIFNNNPAMADNTALFHADHGNLGTAAKLADALDSTKANPLAEMRKLMLLQKGLDGRYITVRPRYLVVPPELEEVALKVTNSGIQAAKAADVNVVGPTLLPIVEPRLHDGSTTAWYGVADNLSIDTVEYAYLQGNEGVFTETRNGFDVDGVEIKCRHVFGAKAIDYRGLFKNAGL